MLYLNEQEVEQELKQSAYAVDQVSHGAVPRAQRLVHQSGVRLRGHVLRKHSVAEIVCQSERQVVREAGERLRPCELEP